MTDAREPSDRLGQPGTRADTSHGGVRIGVRRDGCLVQISFTSNDEYSSIELYDHLVRSLAKGSLRLELGTGKG